MSEYKKASAYIATVNKNAAKPQKKRLAPQRRPTPPHRRNNDNAPQRIRSGAFHQANATKAFHKGKMVLAKQSAKQAGERYAKEAAFSAKTKPGTVSRDVQEAGVKLKAQMAGKKILVGDIKARPAKVLRRPNINDLHEIDKVGLSFPSLHDEFQKTMSLLHGGDVGDHL